MRETMHTQESLRAGVAGLMMQDMVWLKYHPRTPALYQSGVYYRPESGTEEWKTIPYVIADGYGDCEDLGAWRAAELRVSGINATPDIKIRQLPTGNWRAHVVVKLPDGTIEDPSAQLGMYAYGRRD